MIEDQVSTHLDTAQFYCNESRRLRNLADNAKTQEEKSDILDKMMHLAIKMAHQARELEKVIRSEDQ